MKRKRSGRFVPIRLREGDRVYFPGDTTDKGTVAVEGNHTIVIWDRGQTDNDGHTILDVDECDEYGRLWTIHDDSDGRARQVVLVHRLYDPAAARVRAEAARERLSRSLARDERRYERMAAARERAARLAPHRNVNGKYVPPRLGGRFVATAR